MARFGRRVASLSSDAPRDLAAYRAFLEAKRPPTHIYGAPVAIGAVHSRAKPHQAAIIRWAVEGGRCGIFCNFGLGKTLMQIEVVRLTLETCVNGKGLIVCPLGVRQEFLREALALGVTLTFVRTTAEMDAPGIYLTNFESVREGKIETTGLDVVSLDEASVLRGFGGTKTFRAFMRLFDDTPFRFVATATPAPNEYIELLSYAAFLGVMDVGEAKTRFFKRNSEKADQLTIHPHKEEEFWLWVNTWAVMLQKPSDLGFSDDGYALPALTVRWHCVEGDVVDAGTEKDGQQRLIRDSAIGVQEASAEKRASLSARVDRVRALLAERPHDHVILWHDLEDERRALEQLPAVRSVYGSQDLDEREDLVMQFAEGQLPRLAAKPVMLGSGTNLQRHCRWAVYLGVGFKFNDFIQALHRIYRFLQTGDVSIDIIHSSAEHGIVRSLQAKWQRHNEMMERMAAIIRQYGLNAIKAQEQLIRSIGVTRREVKRELYRCVNNDCVEELMNTDSSSVGLIVTSIPFGTQYEYTPSYNDFGHTDNDAHFWEQMEFLSPQLARVLQPGRVFACHVKDRVRPGGLDGYGFQTVSPFHAQAIEHYRAHGLVYMGMITIATDVVRENNQTYRLGWSEKCKDGTRMSVGMPEYVLLFRKPPTDSSNGYADVPVVHSKTEYSRARWQIDAHAVWRSNGNRLLPVEDVVGRDAGEIYRAWRDFNVSNLYDYGEHVAFGEALDSAKRLPPSFSLIPVAADHADVWSDVTRMRTLNGAQSASGKEMHLCPLQFDIVDRVIEMFSNKGDVVLDPFGGLMTVPRQALLLGRRGFGIELNPGYYNDGVKYCAAAEEEITTPTLFDMLDGAA